MGSTSRFSSQTTISASLQHTLTIYDPTNHPNHAELYTITAKMVSEISVHKHNKPFKNHTSRKWNNARPKRADRPPPSPPKRFKDPCLNGDNAFCSLPDVAHGVILKHLPLRDMFACRRLCQRHTEQVERHELNLAAPRIRDSIAEVAAQLEELKVRGQPTTDADSFLDSLSFWLSIRNVFKNRHESTRSFEKWFGFVFGWEESATR
jgi:hypothetical protein